MAERKFSTQLAGQIGEALVVAELGRRGIVATSFAGNVPDIDLVAYAGGFTTHLQVKARRRGSIQLNASKFLRITMNGDRQIIQGIDESLDSDLIYFFVKIGDQSGEDEFFILSQKQLQNIVLRHHASYLEMHNGVRPRNPKSMHVGLRSNDLISHRNSWNVILSRLRITSA